MEGLDCMRTRERTQQVTVDRAVLSELEELMRLGVDMNRLATRCPRLSARVENVAVRLPTWTMAAVLKALLKTVVERERTGNDTGADHKYVACAIFGLIAVCFAAERGER